MATREGADFSVFGPVFDPISKPATGPAWGATGLAAACRAGAIPVFALGGITPDRARELLANPNPPAGIATIGAILAAESPSAAIAEMLSALIATP
jgi:thiamine monophosphate synthase